MNTAEENIERREGGGRRRGRDNQGQIPEPGRYYPATIERYG